jgi:gamma-glutamyltranspeptidase/glutathione hydrolase
MALPHLGLAPDGTLLLEAGRFPAATLDALRQRGHAVREADMTSGLHVLQLAPRHFGAADPRREGTVAGH